MIEPKNFTSTYQEIKNEFINSTAVIPNSLLGGINGTILFLLNDYIETKCEHSFSKAEELINGLIDGITNNKHHSFCSGISGDIWTLMTIKDNDFIDFDDNLIINAVEYLKKKSIELIELGQYDYLHSSLGILLAIIKTPYYSASYDSVFFEKLSSTFYKNNGMFKFDFTTGNKASEDIIDVGVAHGQISLLFIVNRMNKIYPSKSKEDFLITITENYKTIYLNKDHKTCYFPYSVSSQNFNIESEFSRISWCYGDLGISTLLLQFAKEHNFSDLYDFAIEVSKSTTLRTTIENTLITEYNVCHGASGAALLYHFLFKVTGLKEFEESCFFWIKKGISLFNKEKDYCEHGILEGVSGFGLVLQTIFFKETNLIKWQESLLLN